MGLGRWGSAFGAEVEEGGHLAAFVVPSQEKDVVFIADLEVLATYRSYLDAVEEDYDFY